MATAGRSPAAELASLQDRFHLLEGDRKAFYEKSQAELRENKSMQEELRGENKLLRTQLVKLQKEHGGKEGGPGSELHEHELQKLEHQHNVLRQRHNSLASANRDKELQIDILQDQLRDLARDAKRPAAQETPLTRQIRILENRLDKAMIKYNEAMSIKKTYEQIVKRLKEERVNFDHQLQAIEDTLHAKLSDHQELLLMSTDATHARDVARQELGKAEALALEERRAREAELRSRRTLVDAQKAVMSRMGVRDLHRRDVILEAKGDLNEEQEEKLREEVLATQVSRAVAEGALSDETERMAAFQAAFRKIKEATGISDPHDLLHKLGAQEETLASLSKSTDEAQAKLDALNEERNHARAALEELKYAGVAGMGGRQEVEAQERRLSEASAACERARTRYERLSKTLVDLRAGVDHLNAKLQAASTSGTEATPEALSLAAQLNTAASSGAQASGGGGGGGGGGVSDSMLIEVLLSCEHKLLRLIESTSHAKAAQAEEGSPPRSRRASRAYEGEQQQQQHNLRVGVTSARLSQSSAQSLPTAGLTDNEEDDEDDVRARRAEAAVHPARAAARSPPCPSALAPPVALWPSAYPDPPPRASPPLSHHRAAACARSRTTTSSTARTCQTGRQ
jgi:chromosome segregation ATPase